MIDKSTLQKAANMKQTNSELTGTAAIILAMGASVLDADLTEERLRFINGLSEKHQREVMYMMCVVDGSSHLIPEFTRPEMFATYLNRYSYIMTPEEIQLFIQYYPR